MFEFSVILLFVLWSVILYMTVWFLIALWRERNDVVDIAWGLGFILVAWISRQWGFPKGPEASIVLALVTIWGLRLTLHILRRNLGKAEDFRYKKWREEWGKWFLPRTYLQVFTLQGLLLIMVSMPVLVLNTYDAGEGLEALDLLGLLVWAVGFFFEAVGDHQLSEFLGNPRNKGKIMTKGLWRYTRHPNYFGEVVQWWGIWLIALSVPLWYISLIGPLTITVLILGVSGIPMLEKRFAGDPKWEAYKKKTSAFVPLPPGK